jgi:hypothetical protein
MPSCRIAAITKPEIILLGDIISQLISGTETLYILSEKVAELLTVCTLFSYVSIYSYVSIVAS